MTAGEGQGFPKRRPRGRTRRALLGAIKSWSEIHLTSPPLPLFYTFGPLGVATRRSAAFPSISASGHTLDGRRHMSSASIAGTRRRAVVLGGLAGAALAAGLSSGALANHVPGTPPVTTGLRVWYESGDPDGVTVDAGNRVS